jgi:SAM-dependent methyltransferase
MSKSKIKPINWRDPEDVKKYLSVWGKIFDQQIPDQLNKIGDLKDKIFVDLGCGTGELIIQAARQAKKCIGIDISKEKIKASGLSNIEIIPENFIDWKPKVESIDIVWSRAAIHHLTDDEKGKLFCAIFKALRPNGKLIIHDIMFNFEPDEYKEKFPLLLNYILETFEGPRETIEHDIKSTLYYEHSAPISIIKRLIESAGFKDIKINKKTELFSDEIEAIKK